ncbi:MAG: hypothetical protein JW774_11560 [Candidatus Aureabacteria bacterium]|nr:hypothetical protein [Candidatus Auribacterota bacterium]
MKRMKWLLIALLTLSMSGFSFAGGYGPDNTRPNDDDDRELARALNDLDRQRAKTDDLEKKVDDLTTRLSEISSKEPRSAEMDYLDESFPIHGYFTALYSDSSYPQADQTFDQETVNIWYTYQLNETFNFHGDVAFKHGAEISVDNSYVQGVGDLDVVEAWLDTRLIEDKLVLRCGKFYTPFGDWAPHVRPYMSSSIFDPLLVRWSIPTLTNTGIQEYGKIDTGIGILSQCIYVGNGKGYSPHSMDENSNKNLGGRIGLECSLPWEQSSVTFGVNGYIGRDSRIFFAGQGQYSVVVVDATGNVIGSYAVGYPEYVTQTDYEEKIWGLDLKVKILDFTLKAETVKSRNNAIVGHVWKDAWFLQGAYRFLDKFEVYYRHDFGNDDFRYEDSGDIKIDSVGIAYWPIEAVVFKAGIDYYDIGATLPYYLTLDEVKDDTNYHVASAQVAVKF